MGDEPSFCFIMPFHIMEGRGGGAEVQAWYLACELAKRGFSVTYIAQSILLQGGRVEIRDGVNIRWIRSPRRLSWMNAGSYFKALWKTDADIVVQRGTTFITGIAALWCRIRHRRFIWICTDNASPIRGCFRLRQITFNQLGQVHWFKAAVLLLNAKITDTVRNWGMKHIETAFTQNDVQEALLKHSFARDSRRMISGHPLPKKIGSPAARLKNPIVLWVANLGPRKRPEKFIELARLALGRNLRFVLIGGRDDTSYVRDQKKGAPRNIEWLGRMHLVETLTWFDRAAFLVNTSTSEGEGFPNTFIQAWLRGVPVLSIEVDPDTVIDANGLGFVNSDLSVLLAKIDLLSTNVRDYKKLSSHVRKYATNNFSTNRMTDNFLDKLDVGQ